MFPFSMTVTQCSPARCRRVVPVAGQTVWSAAADHARPRPGRANGGRSCFQGNRVRLDCSSPSFGFPAVQDMRSLARLSSLSRSLLGVLRPSSRATRSCIRDGAGDTRHHGEPCSALDAALRVTAWTVQPRELRSVSLRLPGRSTPERRGSARAARAQGSREVGGRSLAWRPRDSRVAPAAASVGTPETTTPATVSGRAHTLAEGSCFTTPKWLRSNMGRMQQIDSVCRPTVPEGCQAASGCMAQRSRRAWEGRWRLSRPRRLSRGHRGAARPPRAMLAGSRRPRATSDTPSGTPDWGRPLVYSPSTCLVALRSVA